MLNLFFGFLVFAYKNAKYYPQLDKPETNQSPIPQLKEHLFSCVAKSSEKSFFQEFKTQIFYQLWFINLSLTALEYMCICNDT